jgi:hypothetical protein
MQQKYFWGIFLVVLLCGKSSWAASSYTLEKIERPVRLPLPLDFVTTSAQGNHIVWGNLGASDATRRELVGVDFKTGKLILVNLAKYGISNANLCFKKDNNTIYIFSGLPGRFFKYKIAENKLTELQPVSHATYWMRTSYAIAPDSKIYVGVFPDAAVMVLDPATEKVTLIDNISTDRREQYVINPAASDDNILYFPVGMHHAELWSYNPQTGAKKQILPANLTAAYGHPTVWTGTDGNVYGSVGNIQFLCKENSIETGKTMLPRQKPAANISNGKIAKEIDIKGHLVLEDAASHQQTLIPTQFDNSAVTVVGIHTLFQGKLYGSSHKPGLCFSYDPQTGGFENLGRLTRGAVRVYDMLPYKKGMYMSSYVGGYIDYYQPGKETKSVVALWKDDEQERPLQFAMGSDQQIYAVSQPVKGHLQGALIRIDPKNNNTKVWRDIFGELSPTSITTVPETGKLFITCTIAGGTSAVPKAKEAEVLLWNPQTEKVSTRLQPIAGATDYGRAICAANGLIYGCAGKEYYVFDPKLCKVIYRGKIPDMDNVRSVISPLLCAQQVGQQKLIYGVERNSGALLQINPANNQMKVVARDKSLKQIREAYISPDGILYYGSGAELMRCRLTPQE